MVTFLTPFEPHPVAGTCAVMAQQSLNMVSSAPKALGPSILAALSPNKSLSTNMASEVISEHLIEFSWGRHAPRPPYHVCACACTIISAPPPPIGVGTREAGGARAPPIFYPRDFNTAAQIAASLVQAANYVDETSVLTRLWIIHGKSTSSIGCVCGEHWGTYKAMYFWHRLFWHRRWYIR